MRQRLLQHLSFAKPLRLALVLSTILLTLPQNVWGVTEEVTKTITFNKAVSTVNGGINNSTMSVSINEQITGGASTSYDGVVNILDANSLLDSYSGTTTGGAVFTLKSTIADYSYDKVFTIEIPGNYPTVPTQVTLNVAYTNSDNGADPENAKIQVGDYGNGNQGSVPDPSNYIACYHYYHPYRSHVSSMTETTLTYTGNNTSGLGTNRDHETPLYIYIYLHPGASFTIKEATITYNREVYGISVAGTSVKSDNATDVLGDGKVSYNATNNTLTLNGATIDYTTDDVIVATNTSTLNVNLLGTNSISCGGHFAFNISNNLNFQSSGGVSPGQLTITSTSNIDPQSFYSCAGTVTYNNDLAATSNGANSVIISFLGYELYIDGTRVTSGNASDVLSGTANAGKVSYNAADNILTLNGASLSKIRTEISGLKINLVGTNTIVASDSAAIQRAIPSNNDSGTAITLSFNGTGNLTITKANSYPSINSHITVSYNDGLVSEDGTSTTRISKGYNLTIAGTTVTELNSPDVFGDSKVSFTPASSGNNNTNTLMLNNVTFDSPIISGLDNLTIEFSGNIKIGETSGYINSTVSTAVLTFKSTSGEIEIKSNGNPAISGFASVAYDGTYLKADHAIQYVSGSSPAIRNVKGQTVSTAYITTTFLYPLWVHDRQVSGTNYTDVLGDGTVSYVHNDANNTGTLTLNGANIDSSDAIEGFLNGLTIYLKGNNSLRTYTNEYSPIFSGIGTAELTIAKHPDATGDVSLSLIYDGTAVPVISGFASVSYSGLNFVSKTGSTLDGATTYDALLSSAAIYPLWVAGTIVTDGTSSGTGWSYNATNNTLTLNNYTKTDNNGHAFISNMDNLNVYLVGTNTVGKVSQSSGKVFYTANADATLTFSTDENNKGSLNAAPNTTSQYDTFHEGFKGIYCNNGLAYYPSQCKIEAKATPTLTFLIRKQPGEEGAGNPTEVTVGTDETLTTTYGSTFYAPKPNFNNGYVLSNDTTRFVYSYSTEGIVEFPTNGTNTYNSTKTDYGEINLIKAGTVTITCSFPGNEQNEACEASYKLRVEKKTLTDDEFKYSASSYAAFISLNAGQVLNGDPTGTGGGGAVSYPTLTQPTDQTSSLLTDLSYGSSDTEVATINENGEITVAGKGGKTTITATIGANDERFNEKTATYDLTIKAPAKISFAKTTASILNTTTDYANVATTTPEGSTVIYSSNNSDVVEVGENNGVVAPTYEACGTVTITATIVAVPEGTEANPQYYYVSNNGNDQAFQATYTLTISKVFNDITFNDGQNYATYYNSTGSNMTVPEGMTAEIITGVNDNRTSVITETVGYLPEGQVVLLAKGNSTESSTYTVYSEEAPEISGNLLKLVESEVGQSTEDKNIFVLYNNEFVKATGTITSGKCYLDLTGTGSGARKYSIGGGNDGSTAISSVIGEANGSEDWYDMQGRRIDKPTKAGLYIVNGKKIVVNNK